MSHTAQKILSMPVPEGKLGVFFMGQAGVILKSPSGQLLGVDLYLSDCCQRYFGFKRLMPQILDPGEIIFDYLLISHAHYDHFDPDSVPILMSNCHTEMIAAYDVEAECQKLNINDKITYMKCWDAVALDDITVNAVPCDHGELAPDALGFLIEINGKTIYYMGDTSFRPDLLENPALQGVDLLLLPINGAFGNLNEEEAAKVVSILKPKMTVPCHYWNFAEHGGNPGLFKTNMESIAPDSAFTLMRQGEGILI